MCKLINKLHIQLDLVSRIPLQLYGERNGEYEDNGCVSRAP